MQIIDTHCHAGHNWFEPVETLLFEMNANAVDGGVLIQHGGTYDNGYLFECAERFPGRFRVAVLVDPDDPDPEGTLTRLAERGAAGIRLYVGADGSANQPALWRKAGELGVVVSTGGNVNGLASERFRAFAESVPDTPIVIEHLAGAGRDLRPPYAPLRSALALSELPNTTMKLPGLGEISERPARLLPHHRFEDVPPFVEMAVEAFGPKRLMWGSDFPPVANREGYRNALDGVRSHPALSGGEDAAEVMGRTAARVWGFDQR